MSKTWKEFEKHVHHIYSMLLNTKDDNVTVARDVILKGRDGLHHQFDVYYEFSRAGIRHKVAIECRKRNRPIGKDAVMAFYSKLKDVIGLQGIMVSSEGFQSGAKKFANDNGISLINLSDLPEAIALLANRLEYVAIPDKTLVGEPFWSLYEVADGRETGTIYGTEQKGRKFAVLFTSKVHAENFLQALSPDAIDHFAVRGLPQRLLRSFILTIDACGSSFLMMFWKPGTEAPIAFEISRADLISEFYVGSVPIPDKPLVSPASDSMYKNQRYTTNEANLKKLVDVLRSTNKINS